MLWTLDCGGNKTINLLSKNSTFSLECFLEDYKNRNKKINEWTKVAVTLQSEIAQLTSVTFSGLRRAQNSSIRKHHKRHTGIFSNSENVFRYCVLKLMTNVLILRIRVGSVIVPQSGLRTIMRSLFSRSFIRRLLVFLTNCQNQEIEKFLEGLCLI